MPIPAILAAIGPKLAATVAGAAIGGLMNQDDPAKGMALGGLGGLGLSMGGGAGIFGKLAQGGLLGPAGMMGQAGAPSAGNGFNLTNTLLPLVFKNMSARQNTPLQPSNGIAQGEWDYPYGRTRRRYPAGYDPYGSQALPPIAGG